MAETQVEDRETYRAAVMYNQEPDRNDGGNAKVIRDISAYRAVRNGLYRYTAVQDRCLRKNNRTLRGGERWRGMYIDPEWSKEK